MSEQNAELTSNLAEAVAENEAKGDANSEADQKIGKLNEEKEGLKNQLGQLNDEFAKLKAQLEARVRKVSRPVFLKSTELLTKVMKLTSV